MSFSSELILSYRNGSFIISWHLSHFSSCSKFQFKMFLRIILISRLCWEILDETSVSKSECSNLNQLRKYIKKIYKGIKLKHYEIYFRYSLHEFIRVVDPYSYKIFFKMDSTKILYMFLLDCDTFIQGNIHLVHKYFQFNWSK